MRDSGGVEGKPVVRRCRRGRRRCGRALGARMGRSRPTARCTDIRHTTRWSLQRFGRHKIQRNSHYQSRQPWDGDQQGRCGLNVGTSQRRSQCHCVGTGLAHGHHTRRKRATARARACPCIRQHRCQPANCVAIRGKQTIRHSILVAQKGRQLPPRGTALWVRDGRGTGKKCTVRMEVDSTQRRRSITTQKRKDGRFSGAERQQADVDEDTTCDTRNAASESAGWRGGAHTSCCWRNQFECRHGF